MTPGMTQPIVYVAAWITTMPALAQTADRPAGAGSPVPAAGASGWTDIGWWGWLAIAIVVVAILFMVLRRRR